MTTLENAILNAILVIFFLTIATIFCIFAILAVVLGIPLIAMFYVSTKIAQWWDDFQLLVESRR